MLCSVQNFLLCQMFSRKRKGYSKSARSKIATAHFKEIPIRTSEVLFQPAGIRAGNRGPRANKSWEDMGQMD